MARTYFQNSHTPIRVRSRRPGLPELRAALAMVCTASLACAIVGDELGEDQDGGSEHLADGAGSCPADLECGSRVCGPDPICGVSCGECAPRRACTAAGACAVFEGCGDGICAAGEDCSGCAPDCPCAAGQSCSGGTCGVAADELLVGDGERPGVVVASDRSVHVVYVKDGVRYRRLAEGSLEPEELVQAGRAHWPQAAVSGDGDVHVVWEDATLGTRIWYARRTAGTWRTMTIHEATRAMLPRIAVDALGRAHIVYWEVLKPEPNLGIYKRVVFDGAAPAIDLERVIAGWNVARNGDVIVDARDVVHVFAGSVGGVNHWTVSETGDFAAAAAMAKPAGMPRTGELFDVALGPDGTFHAATSGNADGTAPVYHFRSTASGQVVWPDIGDPHEAVTTAADRLVPGRAYLLFVGTDRVGRVVVVEADGSVVGPAPFAEAGGVQHTGEHLDRYTSAGDGIPDEEGLWIAYQDDRSGRWQVYLRRVTSAMIEARR